jgi:hypothetical protein
MINRATLKPDPKAKKISRNSGSRLAANEFLLKGRNLFQRSGSDEVLRKVERGCSC